MEIFEKIRNYALTHNVNPYKLIDTFIIAISQVLKESKMLRSETDRIINNINNLFEIFPEGISDIEEIIPYLHKETKEIIDKSLALTLSGNVPNKLTQYSIKDNVIAKFLGIFIDYILYGDAHKDIWGKIQK